jgi:antagonist of KipI
LTGSNSGRICELVICKLPIANCIMPVHIKKPGSLSTLQDLGRRGYAHLGVSPAGAADPLALRAGNLLVGNAENAPALEMTLMGAALEFEEAAIVALTGADCECDLPPWQPCPAFPGTVLDCGPIRNGVRVYLCIRGGWEAERAMGSAATDLVGGFGGLRGRSLRAGDLLRVSRSAPRPVLLPVFPPVQSFRSLYAPGPIRVTRGAQSDGFGPGARKAFFSSDYVVTQQSDRRGLRLQGIAVRSSAPAQLLTQGVPLGAIQIPPDGQPIILFVDQQTTGGYPQIASVVAADVHRVGQLRPGDVVNFEEVSIPEALRLLRDHEEWIRRIGNG